MNWYASRLAFPFSPQAKGSKGHELGNPSKCVWSGENLWTAMAAEPIPAAAPKRSPRPLPTLPGNLHTHMKQPVWQPVLAQFPVHKA